MGMLSDVDFQLTLSVDSLKFSLQLPKSVVLDPHNLELWLKVSFFMHSFLHCAFYFLDFF